MRLRREGGGFWGTDAHPEQARFKLPPSSRHHRSERTNVAPASTAYVRFRDLADIRCNCKPLRPKSSEALLSKSAFPVSHTRSLSSGCGAVREWIVEAPSKQRGHALVTALGELSCGNSQKGIESTTGHLLDFRNAKFWGVPIDLRPTPIF